jgi:plasmid stabilization system protein ParE
LGGSSGSDSESLEVIRLEIRADAAEDLEEAALWYEARRPDLGTEFTDEARSLLRRIAENPLHFPVVYRDARRALLNRFPFAIYFRFVGEDALVIAVMDLRRKASRWRSRV